MHIPPYYKRRGFQYFFVGIIVGFIISYLVFIYINGELTEKWIEENIQLHSKVESLENTNRILSEDKEELNEKNKQKLTIQDIQVQLTNAKQLRLDRFIEHELISKIKEELSSLTGNSIESVMENKSLIYTSVENKTFKIDDFAYEAEIRELIISTKMSISVKITMSST
ncbi:2',3'-cyclic-nucleotide 2'-phosphodiesterase (5'-nucleotidase family) [Salirhabdus euzebyi]|uniref:2',3'-cyclic-nucleotide 2'-phosphodiesterase (5'-nucleotidase family) n=1 Tax=Salirhabdus euzebyi TaxID=394506 RepID=A0A841PXD6_9BACI|nr:sporulation membrane protein YtrI [Salirhabdus euzebyi]MBB6452096.1 2',3'-cyclic-nucleotide 2'-phosphodiesterase (5'-nucleotidase family) [Salirhabdus euzebyi]